MEYAEWNIHEMTGYEPKTTFYMDFSIADKFGENAIRDTYKRAFDQWKSNVVYLTELVMVLNWKSWEHNEKENVEYTSLYIELFEKASSYAVENLRGSDLSYYLLTVD